MTISAETQYPSPWAKSLWTCLNIQIYQHRICKTGSLCNIVGSATNSLSSFVLLVNQPAGYMTLWGWYEDLFQNQSFCSTWQTYDCTLPWCTLFQPTQCRIQVQLVVHLALVILPFPCSLSLQYPSPNCMLRGHRRTSPPLPRGSKSIAQRC